MGHLAGRDLYHALGRRIDSLSTRAPWNDALYHLLKELFSEGEAKLLIGMPTGLSTTEELAKSLECGEDELQPLLGKMCDKGLVIDLWVQDEFRYAPAPMVIGLFEFTMMQCRPGVDSKQLAQLFHAYLDREFMVANHLDDGMMGLLRVIPHEESVADSTEILDHEKADAIVESAGKCAIGICACRHEMMHVGEKVCDVPLESCTAFGLAADYLIRHQLARECSKDEVRDCIARSRDCGLVLSADNVQNNVAFICHCCKCCCNGLRAIRKLDCPNAIVSSNYIAEVDEQCTGCGRCVPACPIDALLVNDRVEVDRKRCLGCGVCAIRCPMKAIHLRKRKQRVFYPATNFERLLLESLERGTLEERLFLNPKTMASRVLKGIVGGFLRLPPVRQTLMSDLLRSRFLRLLRCCIRRQGNGWVLEL